MSIPDFQSFMKPVLECLADGDAKHKSELYEPVSKRLGLTEEDKKVLLPSGTQEVYLNRIAWSLSYMKHAGLVLSPKRGVYQITDRGKKVLERNPEKIDVAFLKQYPEFKDFHKGKKDRTVQDEVIEPVDDKSPQDFIEYGYKLIKDELAENVLSEVKATSPYRFEKIVVDLLLAMGYGGSRAEAGQVTQRTGDGGIDGIINEDKLGLDVIYIQAKRWESTVGRPEIQKFAGALMGKKARKGIFITTSNFSADTIQYAKDIDSRLILIDGERLAKLMIEHNVGVSTAQTYEIKKVDSDYFLEE